MRTRDDTEGAVISQEERRKSFGDNKIATCNGFQGYLNLLKTVVGAGIFSLPVAFYNSGIIISLVVCILVNIILHWTCLSLLKLSNKSRLSTYEAIVDNYLGKYWSIFVSIAGFLLTFGVLCVYGVVISGSLPSLFVNLTPWTEECLSQGTCDHSKISAFFLDRKVLLIIFFVGVIYPLSLFRDISFLSYTSAAGLFCVLVICISVMVKSFFTPDRHQWKSNKEAIGKFRISDIGNLASSITFSNISQHSQFPIYSSLKNGSYSNKLRVLTASNVTSTVLIILFSSICYFTIGKESRGNILESFADNDIAISISRILFTVNILFTAPVVHFICRSFVLNYFSGGTVKASKKALFISTTLIIGFAVAFSSWTCNFDMIITLTGGVSASFIALAIPQICLISYNRSKGRKWDSKLLCIAATVAICPLLASLSVYNSIKAMRDQTLRKCRFDLI